MHAYQPFEHFLRTHSLPAVMMKLRMPERLRTLVLLHEILRRSLKHQVAAHLPLYVLCFFWLFAFDVELTAVTYNRHIAPCSYSQSTTYSARIVKILKRISIGHFIPLSMTSLNFRKQTTRDRQ